MNRQLELIDSFLAEGRQEFSFDDARASLGRSPSGTANALRQLGEKGLVDRLSQGRYAIRPLGSLGTSAVTDDLPLAVGAVFQGHAHRIAYRSALSELGLLSHPVRTVFVAATRQVRIAAVSQRPLRVVIERPTTIHIEAERVGRSWRSTLERALFECALRVDLAGGPQRLAEALAASAAEADPIRVGRLANAFGARGLAAERRLASLSRALSLPFHIEPTLKRRHPIILLDRHDDHVEWVDETFRVAWNTTVDELQAVIDA